MFDLSILWVLPRFCCCFCWWWRLMNLFVCFNVGSGFLILRVRKPKHRSKFLIHMHNFCTDKKAAKAKILLHKPTKKAIFSMVWVCVCICAVRTSFSVMFKAFLYFGSSVFRHGKYVPVTHFVACLHFFCLCVRTNFQMHSILMEGKIMWSGNYNTHIYNIIQYTKVYCIDTRRACGIFRQRMRVWEKVIEGVYIIWL